MDLDLAMEFIDLCIDNYKNGGHSTTKEQEHRYYKLKHQLQDDHEKARKYEKYFEGLTDEILKSIKITFKLQELIEKKIEWASPYKTSQLMNGYLYRELRQLLEDSKK